MSTLVPDWVYSRAGRLVFTGESGIPDPPLTAALRAAAFSSLVGVLVGVVVVLAAVVIGWDDPAVGVAAFGAFGMPRIRRGYRLLAALALTITTAGCLVAGILIARWLPAPWDLFLPLALALTIGSLAGTAVTYLPRRIRSGKPEPTLQIADYANGLVERSESRAICGRGCRAGFHIS